MSKYDLNDFAISTWKDVLVTPFGGIMYKDEEWFAYPFETWKRRSIKDEIGPFTTRHDALECLVRINYHASRFIEALFVTDGIPIGGD